MAATSGPSCSLSEDTAIGGEAQFLATVKVGKDNLMFSIDENSTLHSIFCRISQSWPFITESSHMLKHKMPGQVDVLNRLIDDAAVKDVIKLHKMIKSFFIELVVEVNDENSLTPDNRYSIRESSSIKSHKMNYDTLSGIEAQHTNRGNIVNILDFPKHSLLGVGQVFRDACTLRKVLRSYFIASGHDFYFKKNEPGRLTAICASGNCLWRIHASRSQKDGEFAIRNCNLTHTCGVGTMTRNHPKASRKWISDIVKDKIRDTPTYKPTDIQKDILREFKVEIPYHQAWSGKEKAREELYGVDDSSFEQLHWYCNAVTLTNPGSVVQLEIEPESRRFVRVFISFRACYEGFLSGCRPIIFLDVVNNENDGNWHWFMECLHKCLSFFDGSLDRVYTFYSDRQAGILKAVPTHFPGCYHSFCLRHLEENFRNTVLSHHAMYDKTKWCTIFKAAAYATTELVFKDNIGKILDAFKEDARKFIAEKDPMHWANACFVGPRWGIMNNNIAESFNSWVLEARHLPCAKMIELIRAKLMMMLYERRERGLKLDTTLTPKYEKKLLQNRDAGRKLLIRRSSQSIFEADDEDGRCMVDLTEKTCTCGSWQVYRFPCKHACACIEHAHFSLYDFCEDSFHASHYRLSYSGNIFPIPDLDQDAKIEDAIRPPRTKVQPGRPKKKRIKSQVVVRSIKCSRCGEKTGHNRRTCKRPIS